MHRLGLMRWVRQNRDRAVPEIKDVALAIGVADVEHRQLVHLHRLAELGVAFGLRHPQPLLVGPIVFVTRASQHVDFVRAAVHDGSEGRVPECPALRGRLAAGFDPDHNLIALERHRTTIEQVVVRPSRVEIEFVNLFQVRIVDCVRPAQVLVPAAGEDRSTDEGGPVEVEFARHDHVGFVVGRDRRPGLVRIAHQYRVPRSATAGGEGPHVRADGRFVRGVVEHGSRNTLGLQKGFQNVAAVKRKAHDAGQPVGGDILAGHRRCPRGHAAAMARDVVI